MHSKLLFPTVAMLGLLMSSCSFSWGDASSGSNSSGDSQSASDSQAEALIYEKKVDVGYRGEIHIKDYPLSVLPTWTIDSPLVKVVSEQTTLVYIALAEGKVDFSVSFGSFTYEGSFVIEDMASTAYVDNMPSSLTVDERISGLAFVNGDQRITDFSSIGINVISGVEPEIDEDGFPYWRLPGECELAFQCGGYVTDVYHVDIQQLLEATELYLVGDDRFLSGEDYVVPYDGDGETYGFKLVGNGPIDMDYLMSAPKGPGAEYVDLWYGDFDPEHPNELPLVFHAEKRGSIEIRYLCHGVASNTITIHAVGENDDFYIYSPNTSLDIGRSTELTYYYGLTSDRCLDVSFSIISGKECATLDDNVLTGTSAGQAVVEARLGNSEVTATKTFTINGLGDVDPYLGMSEDEFYSSYSVATSYTDAFYRSEHGFMSGELETPGPEPTIADNQPSYPYGLKRNSNASFIEDGKGYQIYNVEGEVETTVYYGGAYITLEEVAAYVYAFGELPANYIEKKSGNPKTSIWGEYLRLNYSRFNGRPNSYEPELPDITGCGGDTAYYEIDIGTTGTYTTPQYTPTIYNDGNKITRGAARIVFTVSVDGDPIDYPKDRRVFYTCNHYNDFREYLNYYNGWGKIFGNITAGGYFDQRQEPNGPTSYPTVYDEPLFG